MQAIKYLVKNVVIFYLLLTNSLLALPSQKCMLDSMWIGGRLEDFTGKGLAGDVRRSDYVPGGAVLFLAAISQAHFKNGFARLIIGTQLDIGERSATSSTLTQEQFWSFAKEQGWKRLQTATGGVTTDYGKFNIVKYEIDDEQDLLFVTPDHNKGQSDGPSYFVLREAQNRGPFPNI